MSGRTVPDAGRPDSQTARPVRSFLLIALVLLLLKLLLVSRREIITEARDAEAYVSASLDRFLSIIFAGEYHPPGPSLVMALARSIGIPYRIFAELLFAAAAFLFLRPLVVCMRLPMTAAALLYAALLFHPDLILQMDRAMSDSLNFACWLAGAGGILGVVAAPREKLPIQSLGLSIVSFAFAGITRLGEGAIVAVEMTAVAILSFFLFRGADSWRRGRAIVGCFCAVAANITATQALSAAHFVERGYWGVTAVESHEWWRLYSTLLSLPVERNDRYVLVNKATLDMARIFSPDLRDMRECFRDLQPDSKSRCRT
jgi:hypothetical protein